MSFLIQMKIFRIAYASLSQDFQDKECAAPRRVSGQLPDRIREGLHGLQHGVTFQSAKVDFSGRSFSTDIQFSILKYGSFPISVSENHVANGPRSRRSNAAIPTLAACPPKLSRVPHCSGKVWDISCQTHRYSGAKSVCLSASNAFGEGE